MKSGVYQIKNIVNGKLYIGSSNNIAKRWISHKCLLENKKHKNKYLISAWHKYGRNSFIFSIIEYVEIDKLIEREQYYIDYYNTSDRNFGYNLAPNAGRTAGCVFSKETRIKMSISATKRPPISEETKLKLSIARLGNKNGCRIVTDGERKMMSEIRIGINRGENNGRAITNKEEIIAMRKDYDNGMSISKIMVKYHKKNTFTYQIVKRLRWNWLDDSSFCG